MTEECVLLDHPVVRWILWVIGQWKWFAIIGLGLTFLSWIFWDWSEQRTRSRTAFLESYKLIQAAESPFSEMGRGIFSEANQGRMLSQQEAQEFRGLTLTLMDAVAKTETPTGPIRSADIKYRGELAELAGSLAEYELAVEHVEAVLTEADQVDSAAFEYRDAANDYVNSLWRSFIEVF